MADPTNQDPEVQLRTLLQKQLDNIDQYDEEDKPAIRQLAGQYGLSPTPPPESAWPAGGRFLDQLGTNVAASVQGVGDLAHGIWNMVTDRPFDVSHGYDVLKDITRGVAGQSASQLHRAWSDPQLRGMLVNPLTAVPGVGEDILNLTKRLQERDWGGAAADILGVGAQAAGPEVLPGAEAKVAKGAVGMGERMYTRQLALPITMSLRDMDEVGKLGTEVKAPIGRLAGIYGTGRDAIDKLGGPNLPYSIIGESKRQADASIMRNTSKPLDYTKVFAPLKKVMDKFRAAPRGAEFADQLQSELETFMNQHGFIGYQPGLVGPGQRPVKTLRDITVGEGQKLKEAAYGILPNNMWSDTRDSWSAPAREFNQLIAQGLRDAIEDAVPEVKGPNRRMHTAINLRDALIRSEKIGRGGALPEDIFPLMAGAGYGQLAAAAGSPYAGGPGLAALTTSRASRWPAVTSRVGISLADRGELAQQISRALGFAPLAGSLEKHPQQ